MRTYAVLFVVVCSTFFLGCETTPPPNYSTYSDSQLAAEYERLSSEKRFADSQADMAARQYTGDVASSAVLGYAQGRQMKFNRERDAVASEMSSRIAAKNAAPPPSEPVTPRVQTTVPFTPPPSDAAPQYQWLDEAIARFSQGQRVDESPETKLIEEAVKPATVYTGPLDGHTIDGTRGNLIVLDDGSVWVSGTVFNSESFSGSIWLIPIVEGDNSICELVRVNVSEDEDSVPVYAIFTGWLSVDGYEVGASKAVTNETETQPRAAVGTKVTTQKGTLTEAEMLASVTYSGPLDGHRIDKVIDDYIILDDGSVWESASAYDVEWWSGAVCLFPVSQLGPFVIYRLDEVKIFDDGLVRTPVHVSFEGWLVTDSKISGEFNGWDGDTVLVLDNGQIWKQSGFTYRYKYKFRPETVIIKGWAGLCYAIVEGGGDPVRVQCLK